MAELATIARPYAEALFAANGAADASWLDAVAAVAENEQVQQFASNPKVSAAQVTDLLVSAAKVSLSAHAKNFLDAIVDNKRLAALPQIAAHFRRLKNAASGVSDAQIFSAFPLEGAQLAETVALLEKRFGRKLTAQVQLEPELIGGIRVVVGDEVLDASVKARLEQMRTALVA